MSSVRIRDLSPHEVGRELESGALRYHVGPFVVRLRSPQSPVAPLFHQLYGDCCLASDTALADFHVALERPKGLRRWYRPQVRFVAEGQSPFAPFPLDTGFPLLEWGLNWCVAMRAHQYLMLHSAVIERHGKVLLLPAWPGSGKSTLCAALIHRGWRLLSDEFGLIRPDTMTFVPFPRTIPLKNESIEVIRQFAPDAVMGPVFPKTRKGSVAHVKPPTESVDRAAEPAPPAFVVFPAFTPDADAALTPLPKARAFMKLAGNAFNYQLLGASAFRTVASMIDASDCFLFRFGDLHAAVDRLNVLVEGSSGNSTDTEPLKASLH